MKVVKGCATGSWCKGFALEAFLGVYHQTENGIPPDKVTTTRARAYWPEIAAHRVSCPSLARAYCWVRLFSFSIKSPKPRARAYCCINSARPPQDWWGTGGALTEK